jgi:hypothetical protein
MQSEAQETTRNLSICPFSFHFRNTLPFHAPVSEGVQASWNNAQFYVNTKDALTLESTSMKRCFTTDKTTVFVECRARNFQVRAWVFYPRRTKSRRAAHCPASWHTRPNYKPRYTRLFETGLLEGSCRADGARSCLVRTRPVHQRPDLVPGVGLGRLLRHCPTWFCMRRERISLQMLFVAQYILNRSEANAVTLHPLIHDTCNQSSWNNACDLLPPDVRPSSRRSRLANVHVRWILLEVVQVPIVWMGRHRNVSFPLTMAPNVSLGHHRPPVPNGKWIHLGPFMYHWKNDGFGTDDVRHFGWAVLGRNQTLAPTTFTTDRRDASMYVISDVQLMQRTVYNCVF